MLCPLQALSAGPSKSKMREGYWRAEVHAATADGQVVVADVQGHHDAAIWDTTRMLLESALCLATQVAQQLQILQFYILAMCSRLRRASSLLVQEPSATNS